MVCPLLHDGDGRLDVGVGGEDDDEDVGVPPAQRFQHVQSIRVAETVVEKHEVDGIVEPRERLPPGLRLDRSVSLVRQALDERPADQPLVVGDQDRGLVHGCASAALAVRITGSP